MPFYNGWRTSGPVRLCLKSIRQWARLRALWVDWRGSHGA